MNSSKNYKRVLVLNRDYQPLQTISWKKAFIKMYSPSSPVDVVEYYKNFTVNSPSREFSVPSVLVVKNKYINYKRKVSESGNYRKYIYVRDKHTCQYCLQIFDEKDLTVDHVHPKSKGGPNSWENLVACCSTCNTKKADKMPDEARMWPKKTPRSLKDIDLIRYYFMNHNLEEEWLPYLKHIL